MERPRSFFMNWGETNGILIVLLKVFMLRRNKWSAPNVVGHYPSFFAQSAKEKSREKVVIAVGVGIRWRQRWGKLICLNENYAVTEIVIDEEGVCNICGKPYSDSGETAG